MASRSARSWHESDLGRRASERGGERVVRGEPVFEFRLRIIDAREKDTDPPSFLGIVEGFPEVLVHATTVEQAERDLVNALEGHLRRLMDHEATRIDWDDFPTVRSVRLYIGPERAWDCSTSFGPTLPLCWDKLEG